MSIIVVNNDIFDILNIKYYLDQDNTAKSTFIKTIFTNVKFIARNNQDNIDYILCTLDRCDLIIYTQHENIITSIALINLDFYRNMYICGMYTYETSEKKHGTHLMNTIKQIAKNMKINKISLSPINNADSFYTKNEFYFNRFDSFFYFDIK